eukprot:ctg_630.g258
MFVAGAAALGRNCGSVAAGRCRGRVVERPGVPGGGDRVGVARRNTVKCRHRRAAVGLRPLFASVSGPRNTSNPTSGLSAVPDAGNGVPDLHGPTSAAPTSTIRGAIPIHRPAATTARLGQRVRCDPRGRRHGRGALCGHRAVLSGHVSHRGHGRVHSGLDGRLRVHASEQGGRGADVFRARPHGVGRMGEAPAPALHAFRSAAGGGEARRRADDAVYATVAGALVYQQLLDVGGGCAAVAVRVDHRSGHDAGAVTDCERRCGCARRKRRGADERVGECVWRARLDASVASREHGGGRCIVGGGDRAHIPQHREECGERGGVGGGRDAGGVVGHHIRAADIALKRFWVARTLRP